MMEKDKIYNKIGIFLIVYIILIYSIENSLVISWIGSGSWNSWVKPLAWIILILLLRYKIPRMHNISKLTHLGAVRMWAFNCGIAYIIVNILGGLLLGFGKSPYNHTLKGLFLNMIMMVTMLAGRESIRTYLINTLVRKKNMFVLVGVIVLMTFTQITLVNFTVITDIKSLTILLAENVLPTLCQNILATYLVLYGGALSSIIYLGMIDVFMISVPILPSMGWLGKGVIGIMVPSFALVIISESYARRAKQSKTYKGKEESVWRWIPTVIVSVGIIWFTVGVFPIYPSAVVTGSMRPLIDPGDVVIIEKIKSMEEINDLQVGDIMQFKQDNVLIIHRILEIVEEDGKKMYRTKGDHNSVEDRELVKIEDIKGQVVKIIPKIGWPTLIFRSPNSESVEQAEF